ncbi:MAG: CUAEP/CCAEP-tail radical SAM (seleno)protein [Calditrichia bacterium]
MSRVALISTYEIGRQPFGLASPAAWLRKDGFNVTSVDCAVQPFPDQLIQQVDVAAFYMPMYTAARLSVPLIRRAQKLNPELIVIAYGLYAPVNEAFFRKLGVQNIVGAEFEAPLLELCRNIRAGDIVEETVVSLERQQFLTPFRDDLPEPGNYAALCEEGCAAKTTGYTQTTRGCLHTCRHCPIVPVYNGAFRVVQKDVVLADIRQQVVRGAQHITFGDPDFFNGPGHVLPIVKQVHAEFPDITYDVTIKIEHLLKYEKYLPVLRDTGCAFVTSAVEAVEDSILQIFDKGHTREDFVRTVEIMDAYQLRLNPTFVTFTPWTTLQGYRSMLSLLAELGLIEGVSPVQLAIRLLIPAGSRLLEVPDIEESLGEFREEQLGYEWQHSDKRVDGLQKALMDLLGSKNLGRREYFLTAWKMVNALLKEDIALPESKRSRQRATVPYLNEPWYC